MTLPSPLYLLPPFALLLGAGAWLILQDARRGRRYRQRVALARGTPTDSPSVGGEARARRALLGMLTGIGGRIVRSGLLSRRTLQELEQTLTMAGFRSSNGLAPFIGCKVTLAVALPSLALVALRGSTLSPMMRDLLPCGAAVAGLLAPDYVLRSIRGRYVALLERGVPNALDMLVICSQAGLALEPAITRVGTEISSAHPEIAREFLTTANELQVMSSASAALTNLGTRTGLDSLKRLAGTLIQAMQYGTPVSESLRTLSAELRQEALTKFEERAAKLPVMMTLPMVCFILPALFVVVGGPAYIHLTKALHH